MIKISKYLKLTLQAKPSMANLLNLIDTKIRGIKTGKLKMAIKLIFEEALDAMALINVKTPEKAVELKNKHDKNMAMF